MLTARHTHRPAPPHAHAITQRYIVRIIFMVPMYSLASFPSLLNKQNAIYYPTVRDW